MSKRIVRIPGKDLPQVAEKITGLNVNIVLLTGDSYLGVFGGADSRRLRLRDHRGHKHEFALDSVESVIFDRQSDW